MQIDNDITLKVALDIGGVLNNGEVIGTTLEAIHEHAKELNDTLDETRKSLYDSGLSGTVFEQYEQMLNIAENNIRSNDALGTRYFNEELSPTSERTLFQQYAHQSQYIENMQQNMRSMLDGIAELTKEISKESFSALEQAVKPYLSKIKRDMLNVSKQAYEKLNTTMSARDIVKDVLFNVEDGMINRILEQVGGITETHLGKYLEAIVPTVVPSYMRKELGSEMPTKPMMTSVRDMLPESFRDISLTKHPTRTRYETDATFNNALTNDEQEQLISLIMQNQYVLQEAQNANLINRINGKIQFNQNATQGHVNMFAGEIASLFESGARGLPQYGITDITNSRDLYKILRKTNASIVNARSVATRLDELFPWLGIALYENDGQTRRSSFDVLANLGDQWNELSDIQKGAFTSQLAGTMHSSNFYALMQAFAEEDAAGKNLMQKNLDTALNSTGITDKKHEEALKSMTGAVKELQASFDRLIQSVSETDFIIDAMHWLSGLINTLTDVNEELGGIVVPLGAIATLVGVIFGLIKGCSIGAVAGGVLGIGATLGISSIIGSQIQQQPTSIDYSQRRQELMQQMEALTSKEALNEADRNNLRDVAIEFNTISAQTGKATISLEKLQTGAQKAADELSKIKVLDSQQEQQEKSKRILNFGEVVKEHNEYIAGAKKIAETNSFMTDDDIITYINDNIQNGFTFDDPKKNFYIINGAQNAGLFEYEKMSKGESLDATKYPNITNLLKQPITEKTVDSFISMLPEKNSSEFLRAIIIKT